MVNPKLLRDKYAAELTFNLNRFVEEGAIAGSPSLSREIPDSAQVLQMITGGYQAATGVYSATEEAMMAFAAQYSKFEIEKYDELVLELSADFMNLHNGLYVVNLSGNDSIECSLEPPVFDRPAKELIEKSNIYVMNVNFSFGNVDFFLAEKI